MSENFASFYRKASSVRELVGKAPFPEKVRFQITKVIELPANQYRRYMNELLRDVSFISRNVADMRFDGKTETFLCLFVPAEMRTPACWWSPKALDMPGTRHLSLKRALSHWRVFRWNVQAKSAFAGIRLLRDDFFFSRKRAAPAQYCNHPTACK